MRSAENENSANTIYSIIQAHQKAAELHVPYKPKNKKPLLETKTVVEKRCALLDVLKGTRDEVLPKASKVEDAKKDLGRAYAEEQ